MSETEAEKWLETQFSMEADLLELKSDYFKRLQEATSAKKIAQLAQIELEFNRRVLERLKQGRGREDK